ncbi:hypothetical protein HWV62_21310 [Athelia sp. TMB]|nr:hypothetical protein HWV62_21310 [Athelia sp. TMB]
MDTVQAPLAERSSPEPLAEFTKPSLVAHLQKIHSLTRKKKYGAQPTIPPFLREDRRPTLTPLSVQSLETSPVALITESRVPAKAKADRARRLSSKGPLAAGGPELATRPDQRGSRFRQKPKPLVHERSSSPTSGSSHSPYSPPIPKPTNSAAGYGAASMYALRQSSWQYPPANQYFASSRASTSHRSSPSSPIPIDVNLLPASPFVADLDNPFIFSPQYEAAAAARFHPIFNTPSGSDGPEFMSTNANEYTAHLEAQYAYPHAGLPEQPNPYYGLDIQQPVANVDPQVTFSLQDPLLVSYGAGTSSLEGWNGNRL